MKKLLLLVTVLAILYVSYVQQPDRPLDTDAKTGQRDSVPNSAGNRAETVSPRPPSEEPGLARALANHLSDVQVEGQGIVAKVLPDDNEGSRHQRFILRLDSGQTVLIAHNIDLAPRLPSLAAGDSVEFNGEYAWNPQGGVVHWTHRDPAAHHRDGWLKYKSQTYQ